MEKLNTALLVTVYDVLSELDSELVDYLTTECEKLDAAPGFEPAHECGAVFEEADPEIDDLRYQVYELAEKAWDLLKERNPERQLNARHLSELKNEIQEGETA